MTENDLRLTPMTIGDRVFQIPLYQRLFEWGKDPILRLLDDLEDQRLAGKDVAKPYYIGMLTSTAEGDLVDGQQRMTVLLLMGIALKDHDGRWESFIAKDGKPRLKFTARPNDREYLSFLMSGGDPETDVVFKNAKMAAGLKTIKEWLKKHPAPASFAAYVYEYLVFFVTCLPQWYQLSDLNKYFERMNSTGKNLEGHEILKVRLLNKVSDGKSPFYTKAWNRVAEMDTPLFKVRSWRKGKEKENEKDLKTRIQNVIGKLNAPKEIFDNDLLNGVDDQEENTGEWPCIGRIPESTDPPKKNVRRGDGSRAVMSFSDFLLQVLYYFIEDKSTVSNIKAFFNKAGIVKTFEAYLLDDCDSDRAEDFLKTLIRCRILLDVYFVRIVGSQEDYDYDLETPFQEEDEIVTRLKMLESMLYVDSSELTYYQWFGALMRLTDGKGLIRAEDLFMGLKAWDDKEYHPKPWDDKQDASTVLTQVLAYPDVNRYWFWRLDLQIWLKRKELFSVPAGLDPEKAAQVAQALIVADNYVFKKNRSIEHIAPQTRQQNTSLSLVDKDLNSFGNLVMISSSQNSSLSNAPYEEKMARVKAFLKNERTGTIESLKLLHAFTFNTTWSAETIADHGTQMLQLLSDSYL